MEVLNTFNNKKEVSFAYVSLDTEEGSSCVGHWIWECALFLPDIKDLQKTLPYKLKILLREPKQYKINILSDFDFHDDDIIYNNKMSNDHRVSGGFQIQYVSPQELEYILYVLYSRFIGDRKAR